MYCVMLTTLEEIDIFCDDELLSFDLFDEMEKCW